MTTEQPDAEVTAQETARTEHEIAAMFMTPTYAFPVRSDYERNLRDGSRFMAPLLGRNQDGVCFASNPWSGHKEVFSTDALIRAPDRRDHRPASEPRSELIREPQRPMPPGGLHTVLLFQGKRQFTPPTPRKHKELERISYVPRDCYAVWADEDGNVLANPDVEVRVGRSQPQRVHAMQSGRGVIYARYHHVRADPHSEIGEVQVVRVALVRFTLEINPRGDLIWYSLQQNSITVHPGESEEPLRFMQVDPVWHDLVARARQEFDLKCTTVTAELKARYDAVLESARETKRRMDADRASRPRGYGANYSYRY